MKTLLTITAIFLLLSFANAQVLPSNFQHEADKNTLNQGGKTFGWSIPLEPFIVMHNLQDLNSRVDILPAPDTYYANEIDADNGQLIIDCSLPLEPLTAMHNLQVYGSNKLLTPKTNGETIMKLDSSISELNKSTYAYNSEGRLMERIAFSKNNDGTWKPNYKTEYSQEDNLLQEIFSQYNTQEEAWQYYYKNEDIYSDSFLLLHSNHYIWQPNLSLWKPDGQKDYSYDENGNNSNYTVYLWQGSTSYTYYQKESSFSDQNVLIHSVEKINNQGLNQLDNLRDIFNTINAEGQIEHTLTSMWNNNTQVWENNALSDFIYNNQGLVYSVENSSWDDQSNTFIRESRTEYFYQIDNEIQTEINSSWSELFGEWIGLDKSERVLDGFDNQESLNYSYWNNQINNWSPFFKTERIHDTSISTEDIILPDDFADTHSMLLQEDLYQYFGNNYELNSSTQFFYSPVSIVSGIDENRENIKVSIYPNPCIDIVNVAVGESIPYTFELYDISGKQVIEQAGTASTQIRTSGLNSGIYVYRIHSNGLDMSGKIIKE